MRKLELTKDGVSSVSSRSCDHQYGFLPCADNAVGYVFEIFLYQGLLWFGEKQIGRGSKVLFDIFGVGQFGGIVFRILMSIPSMMLMIVSGVFSTNENAQGVVSMSIGIYAGGTVFALTIQWGLCVIYGRVDWGTKSDHQPQTPQLSNCFLAKERLSILKDSGIVVDPDTSYAAGVLLLSLVPYIIVLFVPFLSSIYGIHTLNFVALFVSCISLNSYFTYQMWDPLVQRRSLEYAKYELVREGFLHHMESLGTLVDKDGSINSDVITKLFDEFDKDRNRSLTKDELETLANEISRTESGHLDAEYVQEFMRRFDFNEDGKITKEEFKEECVKWIEEMRKAESEDSGVNVFDQLYELFVAKKEHDTKEIDHIMSRILIHAQTTLLKSESLINENGEPNPQQIEKLFNQFDINHDDSISASELVNLISTIKFGELQERDIIKELLKDFDKDNNQIIDRQEFVNAISKWVKKAVTVSKTEDKTKVIKQFDKIVWRKVYGKWDFFGAVFQLLLGIVMLKFLGGPLIGSILQLSSTLNLPAYSLSFVVIPLATNARSTITAWFSARKKTVTSASLTFSEMYGTVVMNNLTGLTTLLTIIYAKKLPLDFSAEVLAILFVCAVIGILAKQRSTYPLWTCVLAFSLYPLSLASFYFVKVFLGWN